MNFACLLPSIKPPIEILTSRISDYSLLWNAYTQANTFVDIVWLSKLPESTIRSLVNTWLNWIYMFVVVHYQLPITSI